MSKTHRKPMDVDNNGKAADRGLKAQMCRGNWGKKAEACTFHFLFSTITALVSTATVVTSKSRSARLLYLPTQAVRPAIDQGEGWNPRFCGMNGTKKMFGKIGLFSAKEALSPSTRHLEERVVVLRLKPLWGGHTKMLVPIVGAL